MKLKHITPIATIASLAAIISPLTTSCSKGGKGDWVTWDFGTNFEFKEYKHELEQVPIGTKNLLQAYFDFCAKDINNLSYDYMLGWNTRVSEMVETMTFSKMKFKIKTTNVDVEKHYFSFQLRNEVQLSSNAIPNEGASTMMIDVTIDNLEFAIEDLNESLTICPAYFNAESYDEYLSKNDDWSIHFASASIVGEGGSYELNNEDLNSKNILQKLADHDFLNFFVDYFSSFIEWPSYYLNPANN